jgi:poly-gamma-glutamate synthesis protein (capsule biosynthesis protein)
VVLVAVAAAGLSACAPPAAYRAAVPEASRTYVAAAGAERPAGGAPSADRALSADGALSANGVMPAVADPAEAEPSGSFTLALAGDVNFSERTADLLAAGPDTALHEAADQLSSADIAMVNLETAITEGGSPAPKQFHFRAPATALRALAAGGVDVTTMANNHAVDYGIEGLADTLDAVDASPIPVLGIGRDADAAYAPWTTTVNGVSVAIFAASQVHVWTLAAHSATDTEAGIASAFAPRLVTAVREAAAQVDVVIVYLHWGVEYQACPSREQRALADELADAGASAIVGTHAHLLQGAGWRDDGAYVAYGLGNYYWWRSFGNSQDDNGVLTLTFDRGGVVAADFLATRLDERGVPLVATGAQKERIEAQWSTNRQCAGLAAEPASH